MTLAIHVAFLLDKSRTGQIWILQLLPVLHQNPFSFIFLKKLKFEALCIAWWLLVQQPYQRHQGSRVILSSFGFEISKARMFLHFSLRLEETQIEPTHSFSLWIIATTTISLSSLTSRGTDLPVHPSTHRWCWRSWKNRWVAFVVILMCCPLKLRVGEGRGGKLALTEV